VLSWGGECLALHVILLGPEQPRGRSAVLDLVARQPRDVAAAATLLIRVCTLWFGVTLRAAALVRLSVPVTRRATARAVVDAPP
jgi:hypothetical protein